MLKQGVKFLLGEDGARRDCRSEELRVVDLTIAIVVDVAHDGLDLLYG